MPKNRIKLLTDWNITAAVDASIDGAQITAGEPTKELQWISADVPGTVLNALVKSGVYEKPYHGKNLSEISEKQFLSPWWYRTEFELTENQAQGKVLLQFDGINYYADIWLNGILIAESGHVNGAFRRFEFDVTRHVVAGQNVLAVLISPPHPGDYSTGFVDWNPRPPDRNMGIFRPVAIKTIQDVAIESPFVESKVALRKLDAAELSVSCFLINHSDRTVAGRLKGQIEDCTFEQDVTLAAGEKCEVRFLPADFPQLKFSNPRLWWPNHLGKAELYCLQMVFENQNGISDQIDIQFGIREFADYVNEGGHRGFTVNGKKGIIGEISPQVIENFGLEMPIVVMEFELNIEQE